MSSPAFLISEIAELNRLSDDNKQDKNSNGWDWKEETLKLIIILSVFALAVFVVLTI